MSVCRTIGPLIFSFRSFEISEDILRNQKFIVGCRPGLILFVNHDYFYSIGIFFNQKLFCNRRFLRLKLFLFLFDYFSKLPVIVINLTNKL